MVSVLLLDYVCANNPEIVVRNVGERRASLDVAQRVHTGDVRLKPVIGPNESFGVGLDPGRRKIERIGIRGSPDRRQKVRALDRTRLRANQDIQLDTAVRCLGPLCFRIQQDFDAVLTQDLRYLLRHVGVLPR